MCTSPEALKFATGARCQNVMPFVLTHRGGVSRKLLNEMEASIGTLMGGNWSSFQKGVCLRHNELMSEKELCYASTLGTKELRGGARLMSPPIPFPKQLLAEEIVPGPEYFKAVLLEDVRRHIAHMIMEMLKRDGKHISADHSHKVAKMLCRVGGHKVFDSVLQVC